MAPVRISSTDEITGGSRSSTALGLGHRADGRRALPGARTVRRPPGAGIGRDGPVVVRELMPPRGRGAVTPVAWTGLWLLHLWSVRRWRCSRPRFLRSAPVFVH